jgi:MoxR-like ATPase
MPVDPEVRTIIRGLRRELKNSNIFVSDRRWKKIINVLRVASAVNGHTSVDRMTVVLLQHMLWDLPEQRETIRKLTLTGVVSGGTCYWNAEADCYRPQNFRIQLPAQNSDTVSCNSCFVEEKKNFWSLTDSVCGSCSNKSFTLICP